jgi:hypothetical protein
MNTEETVAEVSAFDDYTTEEVVTKKKSNNQLFKEQYGYSKTMSNLMKKHGVGTPEAYRKIRNAKRKANRNKN